jgi:molybdopterin-synthase adenylyltransferase
MAAANTAGTLYTHRMLPQEDPAIHLPPARISDQERYSRQVLFRPLGPQGQQRLAGAHAAIIGVGATGAATASLLARAGVGRLTLIDRDFVEPSNLQRQVLFDEADAAAALPKAEAARRHIAAFNAGIQVSAQVADLVPGNVHELLAGADLLLDGTDNFETRYLLNDYAVASGLPWIYAAAVGAYAATMNIVPQASSPNTQDGNDSARASFADSPSESPVLESEPTACLACVFPAAPQGNTETCDTAGILSTAVNFAASLQATEALKYLSGKAAAMRRTLLSYDLWTGDRSELSASAPDPGCEVCGQRRFRYLAGENRPQITLCGRNSVQIHEQNRPVDFASLRLRLEPLGTVRSNGLLLRFERAPHTLTVFLDGRALIQGTTDVAVARSLYARFIGA